MTRLLIVTAVAAERDAIDAALSRRRGARGPASGWDGCAVLVGGVGPAAAAATTSAALAAAGRDGSEPVGLVLCAGIGGGFGLPVGAVAVASAIVFADLGAETATGFASASELGFGSERYDVAPRLAVELTDRTGGHLGTILTVATVTGTAATSAARRGRYPDAVAEAMEGAGAAAAAACHGLPVAEVRAISNPAGPREREAWRVPEALATLGNAVAAIVAAPVELG